MAYNLGPVKPHVAAAANYFGPKHGIANIGGWRAIGSVPNSDHPKGLALDFMTRDKAKGDALAADIIANAKAYNVTYVIWWRRIYTISKGRWEAYNGPIAHTDHVHASFAATAGTGSIVQVGNGNNPLIPDQFEAIQDFAVFITNPETWHKLAYYVGGALLIMIGALMLAGVSTPGVKDVVKVATKVVKK